jgi:hypothetical protein
LTYPFFCQICGYPELWDPAEIGLFPIIARS